MTTCCRCFAMSLGSGETTLRQDGRRPTSELANGGKQVHATLIDRIQDRWGHTIWRHDKRECTGCKADKWQGQAEPVPADDRKQVLDPHTAYQMTSIMEGRGAARHRHRHQQDAFPTCRSPARPAPPTTRRTPGSSAIRRTSWSASSSATTRRGTMGKGMTGGHVAAPIFGNFMKMALADKKAVPFRIPPGIKLVRVSLRTGHAQPRVAEADTGAGGLQALRGAG